ncbi:orotidine-5'-phosphate decarboxylase [Streptococcus suis]|nr:orotidine-5'-phosphate decarboxylase [Streptococcus suis]
MRELSPIIALDFSSLEEVKAFLAQFPADERLFVKVGMELYYAEGPAVIRYIKSLGHRIFLDLKLHDIPHTVESAMRVLAKLGVDMTNVHAAGGFEMMQAARRGLGQQARLIAVTQLTSTSEEQMQSDQNIPTSLQESVIHYAKVVKSAGLDGIVCSAQEVGVIRDQVGEDFICLTPGIRPSGSNLGDQKRVMTPGQAAQIGSSYIVVGRPITQAENPLQAYQAIKQEWGGDDQ